MKNKLLNISLVIFSVIAVYQAGFLWFNNLSSHNTFSLYTFASMINPAEQTQQNNTNENIKGFTHPYRISINTGDYYKIVYEDLETLEEFTLMNKIIDDNLKNLHSYNNLDLTEVFNKKGFFFEYAFSMPSEIFTDIRINKNSSLSENILEFNTIGIVAFDINTNSASLIFCNNTENSTSIAYEIILETEDFLRFTNLHDKYTSQNSNDDINEFKYISSSSNDISVFNKNVLLPIWEKNIFSYKPIREENPYKGSNINSSGPLLSSIENQITMFFTNPDLIYTSMPNGIFTFSDEYTVVKYYDNHILEYNNYLVDYKAKSDGFLYDYSAAINFIENDLNVVNNYYLSEFKETNKTSKFYFDYSINNLDMTLSNILRMDDNGLNHFIEITIENGRVKNYKKYAYQFFVEDTILISNNLNTYEEFTSTIVNSSIDDEFFIDDLKTSYVTDANYSDLLELSWIMQIDDQILIDRQQSFIID